MAIARNNTIIFSDPDKQDREHILGTLNARTEVEILNERPDGMLQIHELHTTTNRTGWVDGGDIDKAAVPLATELEPDHFADQCWQSSFAYGASAHYLAIVAKLRSDIKVDIAGDGVGLFRLTASEWDFFGSGANPDPAFTDADADTDPRYGPDHINFWPNQCNVFAVMARRTGDELGKALKRPPSVVELCLAQMIGVAATQAALDKRDADFETLLKSTKPADLPRAVKSVTEILTRFKDVLMNAPAVKGEPPAKPLSGKAAINWRNNNPGNLVYNKFTAKWKGCVGVNAGFCVFDTIGNGFRALNNNLKNYSEMKPPVDTPSKIVHLWANGALPGNNEKVYAATFKSAGGFDFDEHIASDNKTRARACYAIATQEGGPSPYSVADILGFLDGSADRAYAAGTVGAALHRLTDLLKAAADETRGEIVKASTQYFSDTPTKDGADPKDNDEKGETTDVGAPPAAAKNPETFADFAAFFKDQLPGVAMFGPEEFLILGATNAQNHLNTAPPRNLWPHILPTVQVLDLLRKDVGLPILTLSVYRGPRYNAAIGGARNSQHMQFRATDIHSSDPKATPALLLSKLRQMRSQGVFKGGLGSYANFVHVDTRGFNVDWEK